MIKRAHNDDPARRHGFNRTYPTMSQFDWSESLARHRQIFQCADGMLVANFRQLRVETRCEQTESGRPREVRRAATEAEEDTEAAMVAAMAAMVAVVVDAAAGGAAGGATTGTRPSTPRKRPRTV